MIDLIGPRFDISGFADIHLNIEGSMKIGVRMPWRPSKVEVVAEGFCIGPNLMLESEWPT